MGVFGMNTASWPSVRVEPQLNRRFAWLRACLSSEVLLNRVHYPKTGGLESVVLGSPHCASFISDIIF